MSKRKLKVQKLNARIRRLKTVLFSESQVALGTNRRYQSRLDRLMFENEQLRWLLTQCPLMNCPDILPHQYSQRMPKMRVYINPITYNKLSTGTPPIQWVLTDFLPEGGIICSPNTMPGIAPLPEEKK